jgi:hypothetical protein
MDRFSIIIRPVCLLFIRNIARGMQFGLRFNNSLSFGPNCGSHSASTARRGYYPGAGGIECWATAVRRGRANILILLAAALGDDLSLSHTQRGEME